MGVACHKGTKAARLTDEYERISVPSLPPPPALLPVVETVSTESLSDGITLIWVDEYVNNSSSEDAKMTLYYLRQLNVASIRTYNDVNSCLTYLHLLSYDEKTQNSKIFLITSGVFASEILPGLKFIQLVDSVFIFCVNRSNYLQLMIDYKSLVIDICTDIPNLCNRIDKRIEELNQTTVVFHFFAQEQNSTRNLTKDSASFLWFQLFQMIISELKCTRKDMNLMLTYCSKQIEKDPQLNLKTRKKMLADIKTFRETYIKDDAIRWYTKESFIYKLLNHALRTEDTEALYIFRYFLGDLCRQLKLEHKEFRIKQSETSPILKVYRGGCISPGELENLKRTVNSLISLNGFISTSMKEWVATKFMEEPNCRRDNFEKVLFIIEVDLQYEDIICAHVAGMSTQKDEDEVLFNIGNAFYLNDVIFDDEKQIWKVYMTATEDGIKAASDYIELTRRELNETSVSVMFGQLFLQMGNYPKAHNYFLELFQQSKPTDPDFPSICYHLALIDGYQGNLDAAENRLNQVFQYHILRQSTNIDLARTKNALGWIYHYNGQLDEAMAYYDEALIFSEERIGLNHLINAQTCSFLGDCYLEKIELDQAEKYYQQALEIESIRLPVNHPRIGVTYNDLGNVFRKRLDMKKALKYYEQAESIFQQSLPANHPHSAYCWSCIAFVYLYEKEIEKAQEYHEKALKIYQKVLPADHINIKISEKNSKCTDFQRINDSYVKICAQV